MAEGVSLQRLKVVFAMLIVGVKYSHRVPPMGHRWTPEMTRDVPDSLVGAATVVGLNLVAPAGVQRCGWEAL